MVKNENKESKSKETQEKTRIDQIISKYHLMLILAVVISIIAFYMRSLSAQEEFLAYDVYYHFYNIKTFVTEGFTTFHPLSNAPFGSSLGQSLGLYMIPVILYKIIGIFGISIREFFTLYPAFIGGLSVLGAYLFTKESFNQRTGLIAAIILTVSIGHLSRTKAGYYRGDAVFLAFFLIALYTIQKYWRVNINQNQNKKYLWAAISTIAIFISLTTWSGSRFGIGVLFLFNGLYVTYTYFKGNIKEVKSFSLHMYPIFLGGLILTYISNYTGLTSLSFGMFRLSIIGIILLSIYSIAIYYLIPKINGIDIDFSKTQKRSITWFGILLLGVIASWIYFGKNPLTLILEEVRSMMGAALRSTEIRETIQELAKTSWSDAKTYYNITDSINAGLWILLSFLGIPIMVWNIVKDKNPRDNFLALTLYLSSMFFLYLAVRFIFLASIGVAIGCAVFLSFFYDKIIGWFFSGQGKMQIAKKIVGIIFIALLIAPTASSAYSNAEKSSSPVINTWKDNLEWLDKNTDETSVAASWWDYGYWIETIGGRRAVADGGHARDRDKMLARLFTGEEVDPELWQMDYFMVNLESMIFHPSYGGGKFLAIQFLADERDSMAIKSIGDAPYVLFPKFQEGTYALRTGQGQIALRIQGKQGIVKAGEQQFDLVVQEIDQNTKLAQGEIGTFIIKGEYAIMVSQKAFKNYLYTDLAFLNGVFSPNFKLAHMSRGLTSMGRAGNYPASVRTYRFRPFTMTRIQKYNGTGWNNFNATSGQHRLRMSISAFGRDIDNGNLLMEVNNKTRIVKENINVPHKNETENPIEFTVDMPEADNYEFYLEQKGPVGVWDSLPKVETDNWSSNSIRTGEYDAQITVNGHVSEDFDGESVNVAVRGTIDDEIVFYEVLKEGIELDGTQIDSKFDADIDIPDDVLEGSGESKRIELIFEGEKKYELGNLRAH